MKQLSAQQQAYSERAQARLESVNAAMAKLKQKLNREDLAHKHDRYAERIMEYELSQQALMLEIATGNPMRIGGNPSAGGVEISVPAGGVGVEGKPTDTEGQ